MGRNTEKSKKVRTVRRAAHLLFRDFLIVALLPEVRPGQKYSRCLEAIADKLRRLYPYEPVCLSTIKTTLAAYQPAEFRHSWVAGPVEIISGEKVEWIASMHEFSLRLVPASRARRQRWNPKELIAIPFTWGERPLYERANAKQRPGSQVVNS